MDYIKIGSNSIVRDGLELAIEKLIGPHEYVKSFVPMEIALLIVRLAKISEDKPEYFPKGKWATIQAIENNIDNEFDKLEKPR